MRDEVVCIGGPADGKRFRVDSRQGCLVTYDLPPVDYKQEMPAITQDFVYDINKIAGSSRTYKVAVPRSMTGDEIVEHLLKGYKNANA